MRSTRSNGSRSSAALRLGDFDVLVGINLLREGLDLPEVSLVSILDADKEGFLRSRDVAHPDDRTRRPQRRRSGDHVRRPDDRLDAAGDLGDHRRRKKQLEYNAEHGIDPQTVRKKVTDILEMLRGADGETTSRGRRSRPRAGSTVAALGGVRPVRRAARRARAIDPDGCRTRWTTRRGICASRRRPASATRSRELKRELPRRGVRTRRAAGPRGIAQGGPSDRRPRMSASRPDC